MKTKYFQWNQILGSIPFSYSSMGSADLDTVHYRYAGRYLYLDIFICIYIYKCNLYTYMNTYEMEYILMVSGAFSLQSMQDAGDAGPRWHEFR